MSVLIGENTAPHSYEYIRNEDIFKEEKLSELIFPVSFDLARTKLFAFYEGQGLLPQSLCVNQFNDVFRFFFISGNALVCLGPRVRLKFTQNGELIKNDLLLTKIAEYYCASKETFECLKETLAPLIQCLYYSLKKTEYTSYHEAYLKYLYAAGSISILPFEYPNEYFYVFEDVLYYINNNQSDRKDEVVSISTFNMLLCKFGGREPAYCNTQRLYDALFDLLKSDEITTDDEAVYVLDPDVQMLKHKIYYRNDLNKFESVKYKNDRFPLSRYIMFKNRLSEITPTIEEFLSDISGNNTKQIELLAELFARIASVDLPSKFLWIVEGTTEDILNFNNYINEVFFNKAINCTDLSVLCPVKSLRYLLNEQAIGNLAVISHNGKCDLQRANQRLSDILKGKPMKGDKDTLWNKSYPVKMVFIYCTENSNQILDTLKYIPTVVLPIKHFNYNNLNLLEKDWLKENLILLGLKRIKNYEYKLPKTMNDFERSIMDFTQNRCSLNDKNKYTVGGELYSAYKAFCIEKGYQPLGKTGLLKRISDKYKLKYAQNRQSDNKKVVWGISLISTDIINSELSSKIEQPDDNDFNQELNRIFSFEFIRL